jgi:PEP-CTERM motif-containing protein
MRLTRAAWLMSLVLLLTAVPARATPLTPFDTTIGTFSWQVDELFGPIFTVENFAGSGFDFTDVVINITLADNSIRLVDVGTIAEGTIAQTFDDLTSLAIQFATLTFNTVFVGNDPVPGSINVAPVVAAGETQSIDFSPASSSIPEPSTLLLMGCGIALAAYRRVRAR